MAQWNIAASATGQYENSTNIFAAEGGYPIAGVVLGHLGDQFYAYGGNFTISDQISQQKIFASATGAEYRYDTYTLLNHDDYKLDGGLNWKVGLDVDGTFDVTRTHAMVPFIDVIQLVPAFQTEQREAASIEWLINPQWRIASADYYRGVDEPVMGAPNLKLTERVGTATVTYLGEGPLSAGVMGGYLTGNFTGVTNALVVDNPNYNAANYDQVTYGLVANYANGGPSKFSGGIGYTRRTSVDPVDAVSGITGNLDYKNQLTGKTAIELQLARQVSAYVATGGSLISDAAGFNVNWQATYKIDVIAGYNWTFYDFPGQGNNPPGTDRHDYLQFTSLVIDYNPVKWLELKPYANVTTRRSTLIGGDFNATVYGIYVSLKYQNPPM